MRLIQKSQSHFLFKVKDMPAIKPYCTSDDIRQELPLKVGKKNSPQKPKIIEEDVISAWCVRVSALMDRTFSQNGYVTPIDFGTEGDTDYDQLLDLSLKEIAVNGVCSKVIKATQANIDEETNIYETMFLDGLTSILRKGFPSYVARQEGAQPLQLVTVKTQRVVPWFSTQGINFD